jgi:hypothetical protein
MIREWYDMDASAREQCGIFGRQFCLDPAVGLSAKEMCRRMMTDMDLCFNAWTPRQAFTMHKILPKVKEKISTGITLRKD